MIVHIVGKVFLEFFEKRLYNLLFIRYNIICCYATSFRGSVGRATHSLCVGHRFESGRELHVKTLIFQGFSILRQKENRPKTGGFSCFVDRLSTILAFIPVSTSQSARNRFLHICIWKHPRRSPSACRGPPSRPTLFYGQSRYISHS